MSQSPGAGARAGTQVAATSNHDKARPPSPCVLSHTVSAASAGMPHCIEGMETCVWPKWLHQETPWSRRARGLPALKSRPGINRPQSEQESGWPSVCAQQRQSSQAVPRRSTCWFLEKNTRTTLTCLLQSVISKSTRVLHVFLGGASVTPGGPLAPALLPRLYSADAPFAPHYSVRLTANQVHSP